MGKNETLIKQNETRDYINCTCALIVLGGLWFPKSWRPHTPTYHHVMALAGARNMEVARAAGSVALHCVSETASRSSDRVSSAIHAHAIELTVGDFRHGLALVRVPHVSCARIWPYCAKCCDTLSSSSASSRWRIPTWRSSPPFYLPQLIMAVDFLQACSSLYDTNEHLKDQRTRSQDEHSARRGSSGRNAATRGPDRAVRQAATFAVSDRVRASRRTH